MREARRQSLIGDATRLQATIRANKKLADEYNRTNDAYGVAAKLAEKAADKRRDASLTHAPEATYLKFAKAEQTQVGKMIALGTQRSNIDDRIAVNMETVLDADDVQKFRTDAQAFHSQVAVGLENWSRACALIVDNALQADNGETPQASQSDIEHDYQQSGDELGRTDNLYQADLADYDHLLNRIKARLHDEQVKIAQT